MKAFLSHSTTDKPFVDRVAHELTRSYCHYDIQSFNTGADLEASIEQGLDSSAIFVLFASKAALKSMWVDFEQKEARHRQIAKHIRRTLVFIIDDSLTPKDLPDWLTRALVKSTTSAKAAAREIRQHLNELFYADRPMPFIGRTHELGKIKDGLLPINGAPPRILMLSGLMGVGRRALADRVVRDVWTFRRVLQITIEDGDDPSDVAIKLSSELEPTSSIDELKERLATAKRKTEAQLFAELQRLLRLTHENREFPLFVEAGNTLREDGSPGVMLATLISATRAEPEAYSGFITSRFPRLSDEQALHCVALRLTHLPVEDTKRLINALAATHTIHLAPDETSDLATYVSGHPPAVQFAISLISRYGKGIVLADKSQLVDYRADTFLRYLERKLDLSETRKHLLSLLAVYSPLPPVVLGRALDLDIAKLSRELEYLIDTSLVEPDGYGMYHLAPPVQDAVTRFTGHMSIDHARIAEVLRTIQADGIEDPVRLDLVRAAFRAMGRAGLDDAGMLHLRSDVNALVKQFYDAREYERAEKWGRLAIAESPDNWRIAEYLIKSIIQQEKYDEAAKELSATKILSDALTSYLSGFLERKRGKPEAALEHYRDSLRNGRRGVAIHREMALCYLALDRFDEAKTRLEEAERQEQDNRFVLDLWVKLAVRQGDENLAKLKLKRLESADKRPFYLHRLSTVESAFGNRTTALAAIDEACALEARPTFEMISQLSKCRIDVGQLDLAQEALKLLESRFGLMRKDIRIGLQIKLETKRGNYDNALALWTQLKDKARPVHKALRREALSGLLSTHLNEKMRARYAEEVKQLSAELAGVATQALEYSFFI